MSMWILKEYFYIPPHNSGGVLWLHLDVRPSIRFSFPVDNFGKHQWIFTKLGMCIDIVEIWFGIANGQIFTELSARDTPIFSFPDDNLSKYLGILTKLAMCIDLKEICFGIANGQISSNFYGVICPRHTHIFVSRW